MDSVSRRVERVSWWDLALFADDVAMLAESVDSLQMQVDQWVTSLETHGMTVNFGKCEVISLSRQVQQDATLVIGGKRIESSNSFRYLGSILCGDPRCEDTVS